MRCCGDLAQKIIVGDQRLAISEGNGNDFGWQIVQVNLVGIAHPSQECFNEIVFPDRVVRIEHRKGVWIVFGTCDGFLNKYLVFSRPVGHLVRVHLSFPDHTFLVRIG